MEAESSATTPTRRRSSKRKSQEAVVDVEMEEQLPVSPTKSKKKVKTLEESSKEEEAPKKMSRREQKMSLGAQLTVPEDDEVSIVDEVAGPSVPKAKPKARSTKSLDPGSRKEPAYKSRRKTITTLGAVDIIPSLPEDQPTDSEKKRASEKPKPKKKYVPIKKKTSVKIDY